jgi:hypothetical protein
MNDRKNSIRIQECDAFVKGDDRGGMYVLEVISDGFTANENIDFSKKVIEALNHHGQLVEVLRNMVNEFTQPGYPTHTGMAILHIEKAQDILKSIDNGK